MVALTRELEANHLLGVGALAGVAQRAVPLGQRRRQPGDVGVAALELVAEFGEASGEVGGRGLGGGRPGPLGVKRSFGLTQLLLASCLLKLEHANAAGLKHRGDRLGGGRLDGAGRRGRSGRGSDGSGTSTAPSCSHARTSADRATVVGTRKLMRHVPGIIPVSPGGSGIAGKRCRSPPDSTTSHGCPGEVGRRRQRPLMRTLTRSPASSSHSTASIPRAATMPGSVMARRYDPERTDAEDESARSGLSIRVEA